MGFSGVSNRWHAHGKKDRPLRAPASFLTTRRSPWTSSFSFPVSLRFSSSYSSSFSSWRTRVRWVSAAVTVLVAAGGEPAGVDPAAHRVGADPQQPGRLADPERLHPENGNTSPMQGQCRPMAGICAFSSALRLASASHRPLKSAGGGRDAAGRGHGGRRPAGRGHPGPGPAARGRAGAAGRPPARCPRTTPAARCGRCRPARRAAAVRAAAAAGRRS